MRDADETDEQLLARYAQGDAPAFETLYRRHEMRVWRYLERNVGNRATADELMQEVWFAVAREAPRYRPNARNRMIDSIRTTRPQLSLETVGYEADPVVAQLTTEPSVGPLAAVLARDDASALARAMSQLPREQRDAFLLQVEGDLSVDEVAAITRSSAETTKSRLRYARTKLRTLLGEYA
jgi:RNA polymerase sigma factor (sigma-70 family)